LTPFSKVFSALYSSQEETESLAGEAISPGQQQYQEGWK